MTTRRPWSLASLLLAGAAGIALAAGWKSVETVSYDLDGDGAADTLTLIP